MTSQLKKFKTTKLNTNELLTRNDVVHLCSAWLELHSEHLRNLSYLRKIKGTQTLRAISTDTALYSRPTLFTVYT